MASSSQTPSSSTHYWKYDVFLSFRGPDTRKGITSELYHRLQNRGVKTFMDNQDLKVGDVISPTLSAAIKESRFAIVVLSQNYAFSTWCLEELRMICLCMEDNIRILPIFYHVDPADVRHQKRSLKDAFTEHLKSGRHTSEKLEEWKAALKNVANISGWNTDDHRTHQEMIDSIVESVSRRVLPTAIEPMGELEEFQATRQAMDEVMNALKDDTVDAVAVYGMGGVGKTSLVKHVSAQAKKEGLFDHVVMVVVSQNPDFGKLQDTVAEQLGFKLWEETELGRIGRLNKEIMRREKLLLILDDVWGRTELSKIGIPSYKELQKCKSKVLLTTRRLNVCHTMEIQATIHLTILSEEDAWSLFLKKAKKSFQKSTEFYEVARKVAKECAGLPVALIAVARALGDKDFQERKEAARRLEMSQPSNLDEEKDVFDCIKLSYDYLNSNDAKSCFLLCCLFPEDYDIEIEDLMKYGFGTGLFRDANSTIENARARASSVTKYLKASCLLLDSTKEGCVRMHDVIRDTAISIAFSVDGHASLVNTSGHLKDWSLDAPEGYSAISLMGSNICELPNKLVCSKLQILLLHGNYRLREIPVTFFQSPNDIRVLALRETNISSLPSSLSLLTRLQALHLDRCKFTTDIPMLGKLKNLEILSMRRCSIKKFPKELGNLTNLRMLDLNLTRFETLPSQVIPRLSKLEELYINNYYGDWGSEVDGGCLLCSPYKNADFDELIGLSCLTTLEVSVFGVKCLPRNVELNPNWVNFHISISIVYINDYSGRCSRGLTISTTMKNLPEWFISAVTAKTEALCYVRLGGLSNLIEEHGCGRLNGLKYLFIDVSSDLKVLLNTITWTRVSHEPVFENLVELAILNCTYLEELCGCELPPGSLRNLKILNMMFCERLVKPLLSSKLLRRLHSLEKVACSELTRMEYVFGFEEHEPQHVVWTELRVISLTRLYRLISICNGPAPPGIFQSLKLFYLEHCRKLEYLFTFDVARCLLQLEDLYVAKCNSFDRIIEASEETESNKIIFPQLKNLLLAGLPKLTRLCSTSSKTVDIEIECPSLEHLHVYNCPQFSFSASDFNSSNQVRLNHLQHCAELNERIFKELNVSQFPVPPVPKIDTTA